MLVSSFASLKYGVQLNIRGEDPRILFEFFRFWKRAADAIYLKQNNIHGPFSSVGKFNTTLEPFLSIFTSFLHCCRTQKTAVVDIITQANQFSCALNERSSACFKQRRSQTLKSKHALCFLMEKSQRHTSSFSASVPKTLHILYISCFISDANECTMIPNICAGGTCVNTRGSYRCDCGKGRLYDAVKHRCTGMHAFVYWHVIMSLIMGKTDL